MPFPWRNSQALLDAPARHARLEAYLVLAVPLQGLLAAAGKHGDDLPEVVRIAEPLYDLIHLIVHNLQGDDVCGRQGRKLRLRPDDRAHLEDGRHAHIGKRPVPVQEVLPVAQGDEIYVLVLQAKPYEPFELLGLVRVYVFQPLTPVEDEKTRPPAFHNELSARRYDVYRVARDGAVHVPDGLPYVMDGVVPDLRVEDVRGDAAELRGNEGVEHRRLPGGSVPHYDHAAVAEKGVEEPRRLLPADVGEAFQGHRGKPALAIGRALPVMPFRRLPQDLPVLEPQPAVDRLPEAREVRPYVLFYAPEHVGLVGERGGAGDGDRPFPAVHGKQGLPAPRTQIGALRPFQDLVARILREYVPHQMGEIENGAEHRAVPDNGLFRSFRYLPFDGYFLDREDKRVYQLDGPLGDVEPPADLVVDEEGPVARVEGVDYLRGPAERVSSGRPRIVKVERAEEDEDLPGEHLLPAVFRLRYELLYEAFQRLDVGLKRDLGGREDLFFAEAGEGQELFVEPQLPLFIPQDVFESRLHSGSVSCRRIRLGRPGPPGKVEGREEPARKRRRVRQLLVLHR